jgi:hypothetical protein
MVGRAHSMHGIDDECILVRNFEKKWQFGIYGHRRQSNINPLTPELNPSAQRCLARFFYLGFCFLNRGFC